MPITLEDLFILLDGPEGEHLEVKEAKASFSREKAIQYCCALANEGGGKLVLGVSDARPRSIVGSQAFPNLQELRATLMRELHLKVGVDAYDVQRRRVVVFDIPSHPLGVPLQYQKIYWCRSGEELIAMKPHQLRQIFDEIGPDFSAEICEGAALEDLDVAAVKAFRERWAEKSRDPKRLSQSITQLLADAELADEDQLTYAALILLGSRKALNRHLGQAEVIFEYRSGEAPGPAQERHEFRIGALLCLDALWELVNKRNDLQSYQDGLYMKQIATFNEGAVREAILNAIAHRDYRLHGSVFVRQFPRKIRIESPGGLLPGITPETILRKQAPRNRRLAEALARTGLVERSGQGFDRILGACVLESKPKPCFDGTDDYQVFLTLEGQIQDERFLRLLEAIGQEQVQNFDTGHLLVLDLAYREQPIPADFRPRVQEFIETGVLEQVGRGPRAKIFPSRRLMASLGERGRYTRLKGLDRPTQRALLLQHIRESPEGAQFDELQQVLPGLPERTIRSLMQALKEEGQVHTMGKTRGARWFVGPASNPDAS